MAKKQFYAVARGRFGPCICSSWPEASRRVERFSQAIFKGFITLAEAEEFMKEKEVHAYERLLHKSVATETTPVEEPTGQVKDQKAESNKNTST